MALPIGAPIHRFLGWNTQGDLGPYTFYTASDQGLVIYLSTTPRRKHKRQCAHYKNKFRLIGAQWQMLTPEARADWELASKRAGLRISGYNLYTYWLMSDDRAAITTVERHSGVTLDKTSTPL
jgi:hypothetical protein